MNNLTEELTLFVKELLLENSKKKQPYGPNWEKDLEIKIECLVRKYENGILARKRASVFTIGDDSSYSSDFVRDAEVQVNFSQNQLDNEMAPEPSLNNTFEVDKGPETQRNFDDDDEENLLAKLRAGKTRHRQLESFLDKDKSVAVRRQYIQEVSHKSLANLPFKHYDYTLVNGACCENIIGFVQIPVGVVGPLKMDVADIDFDEDGVENCVISANKMEDCYVPMATTEGALVASTNRGCKAINESGGVKATLFKDAMSRAPVVSFESAREAVKCSKWIDRAETFQKMKKVFESTSGYAKLKKIESHISGHLLHIRFEASTGDAMGMNMVSKAVNVCMDLLGKEFPNSDVLSLSGNTCADKKASGINLIKGRGKSVVAEAKIKRKIVEGVLKTTVEDLVRLGSAKLNNGALNALSIGGANAHSANIVAAIFLATGQDAAQVVSSHMCTTILSKDKKDGNLKISCTMDCLEVGTVGGGTILSPQQACLEMLSCKGSCIEAPGKNAQRLAKIICCTVLAGELSLLASQCSGDLVQTHMRLNRSSYDLFQRPIIAAENLPSPLAVLSKSAADLTPINNGRINFKKSNNLLTSYRSRDFVNPPKKTPTIVVESPLATTKTPLIVVEEEFKSKSSLNSSSVGKVKKAISKCEQSFT